MNLVDVWSSIIERQAIHRGTFRSVRDLNARIRSFITGRNDRSRPFCLLLNLAVGGPWPGTPTPETKFPATLLIDYVRIYK